MATGARRPSLARIGAGPGRRGRPESGLWWTGAGVEPVAGYGASPAPFPQFLPRWARAEALDRPTGTTVAALDARRRVPRRPDVVQLDAGEIAGNDRVPLGGRVRSRPRPCSWSTCPARPTTESPQLVDVSGLDRGPAAGRRAPVVTPRIRLKALEEPDFAPISVKPASQPARRGPPGGRGSVLVLDPSRQRVAPVRGHARQRAHSHIEHQGDGLQLARSSVARATHTCA